MVAKENGEERDNLSSDMEKDAKQSKEGDSDYEPARDSLSSQGETPSNDDNKVKRSTRVPKKIARKEPSDNYVRASRGNANRQGHAKLQFKPSTNGQKKSVKPSTTTVTSNNTGIKKPENVRIPSRASSEVSEELDDKTVEEVKEIGTLDENPNCDQSIGTDDDTVDPEDSTISDDKLNSYQKIQQLEQKIEKLEEELREVAALEISLYSVVPEHGSSAHKVHTPARRLSRLYIHACKYWSQDKRATVARNTVSGLVLVSKSCGSDVPRLTFWLSNTIVLREIISQAFGSSSHSNSALRLSELNGRTNITDRRSVALKSKNSPGSRQTRNLVSMQLVDDWQDTSTFVTALMKIESWIFHRIVESVWWQALTPHMQSPAEDQYTPKSLSKLSGPVLGDQQQGTFSVNLWKSAFRDAFTRLCPVRAGGHECGCLPILARMVMERCVSRLDVAMFNAILRESANEIPTDPVSDPILDPKVLPIPAGNLSFGSGAQLKNSIGNWSRWLTDLFGMDVDDSDNYFEGSSEDDDTREDNAESKSFRLLNELSDLLMLPKDMLLDRVIRKEVCASIGLPLMMRILCNFTPDEFCPDAVPGIVLEELNTESILERRLSDKDLISSFPCAAAPVTYSPPLPADVATKVADIEGRAELDRRASIVQRKGYTSDDDLEELDSPLNSIIMDKSTSSPNGHENSLSNSRYKLLREVWSVV